MALTANVSIQRIPVSATQPLEGLSSFGGIRTPRLQYHAPMSSFERGPGVSLCPYWPLVVQSARSDESRLNQRPN